MEVSVKFLLIIVVPSIIYMVCAYSMSMVRRYRTLGSVLATYMIYLAACASIMSPDLLPYVLPIFGRLNSNDLGLLINLTGGVTLAMWVAYAVTNNEL